MELDQFFSWLYETKKVEKPLKNLIASYKNHIRTNGLEDEVLGDYRRVGGGFITVVGPTYGPITIGDKGQLDWYKGVYF